MSSPLPDSAPHFIPITTTTASNNNMNNNTGFVTSSSTPAFPAQQHQPKANALTKLPSPVALAASVPMTLPRGTPTSFSPGLTTSLDPQLHTAGFSAPAPAAGGGGAAIVMFRSDLRLDDHPALSTALEGHSTIIPVFCFDPRHFGRTPHGFDKTGKYRARFLIESVRTLRDSLRHKGGDLVVRIGRPEDVVVELAKKTRAGAVYLHSEVTYEDQLAERQLEKALKKDNVEFKALWSNTLYHRDDMPFPLKSMPDVYSDFREAMEIKAKIQDPLPAPEEVNPLPHHVEVGDIPSLADLGITELVSTPMNRLKNAHDQGVTAVRGGEKEAMARVATYVTDARRMEAQSGNGQSKSSSSSHIGADFSCRISPWLALGCVSPRRIFKEMKNLSNAPAALLRSSTYFELVWRDFFRCITAKYSEKRVTSPAGNKAKNLANVRELARV